MSQHWQTSSASYGAHYRPPQAAAAGPGYPRAQQPPPRPPPAPRPAQQSPPPPRDARCGAAPELARSDSAVARRIQSLEYAADPSPASSRAPGAAPPPAAFPRQRSDSEFARQLAAEEYGAPISRAEALSPRWQSRRPSDYLARGAYDALTHDSARLEDALPGARPRAASPPHAAPASPTGDSRERRALDANLVQFGFEEVCVAADGNCQFRSIAWSLWGSDARHAEVRGKVAAQLRAHPPLYQNFVVDGDADGYAKFCMKVGSADEWGDHLTLQAAADAYRLRFKLVTSHAYDDAARRRGRAGGAVITIRPRGAGGTPLAEGACKEVWLSFYEEQLAEHYNPIRRVAAQASLSSRVAPPARGS